MTAMGEAKALRSKLRPSAPVELEKSARLRRAQQQSAKRVVELLELFTLEMTRACDQFGGHRIDRLAIAGDLEVQMRPGRKAT